MKEAYLLLFLLLLERGWAFTCKGSITRLGYTPDRWNPVVSLNEQPLGQIFQNFESLGELYNAELYILSSIIGTVNLRVTVREETSPHPILDNSWTGHVLGYTDAEVEVEKPWSSIAMHFNFHPPLQLYVGRMYSFSVSAPPGYQDIASTTYIEVVISHIHLMIPTVTIGNSRRISKWISCAKWLKADRFRLTVSTFLLSSASDNRYEASNTKIN
jgi:hypothetical protein